MKGIKVKKVLDKSLYQSQKTEGGLHDLANFTIFRPDPLFQKPENFADHIISRH